MEKKARKKPKKGKASKLGVPHLMFVDEKQGERLFMVVDYTRPGDKTVRRIISKRLANGQIEAVMGELRRLGILSGEDL